MPTENILKLPDYAVITGYFVIMIAIGIYCSGRIRNLRDFFGGSGQVPWWLAGISFWMTSFSTLTFVIYSEMAYRYGLVAITLCWMGVPAILLSAHFFAARWRRAAKTSPIEYIEDRFGGTMRQCLAWLTIPLRTIDNGLKLFALGTMVSGVLGFPIHYAIVLSGSIAIIYTFMGGMWAVLVSDFIQAIVMIVAIVTLVPLALIHVGGISTLLREAPAGFFRPTTETFTPWYLFAFFVSVTLNYSTSWSLVQRYYIVNKDSDARKVGYLVAVLLVLTPLIILTPAMAARVFMPGLDAVQVKQVYPLVCVTLMPVGMIGMLIAAFFASTMSTVSAEWNALSSVMTNDVYKRLINPDASDRRQIFVGKITTLGTGLCCLAIALLILGFQQTLTLFEIMINVFTIFLPAVSLPMLAGLVNGKISNGGALGGLWLGTGVGLLVFFLGMKFPFLALMQNKLFITIGATIVGMIVGTLWLPATEAERKKVQKFFNSTQSAEDEAQPQHGPSSEEMPDKHIAALTITGLPVAGIGLLMSVVILLTVPLKEGWLSLSIGVGMIALGLSFWLLDRFYVSR